MSEEHAMRCNRLWMMPVLAVMSIALCGQVHAHIKNEASQFPDIEFSEARFDIVMLVGAGIIPETAVFEPDNRLSKKDLASWAALARGLGPGGETPDIDKLAAAAVRAKLLDSLEGDASYADLNAALFAGELAIENAPDTLTKGQAAHLIARHLNEDAARSLLEPRKLRIAENGVVAAVESRGGHGHHSYYITVGDVTRKMYEHGRVANGPADLLQWQGRTVRRSIVRDAGNESEWIYLEAEPLEAEAGTGQLESATGEPTGPAEAEASGTDAASGARSRTLLYWLLGAVLVLGVALFVRQRRS